MGKKISCLSIEQALPPALGEVDAEVICIDYPLLGMHVLLKLVVHKQWALLGELHGSFDA